MLVFFAFSTFVDVVLFVLDGGRRVSFLFSPFPRSFLRRVFSIRVALCRFFFSRVDLKFGLVVLSSVV